MYPSGMGQPSAMVQTEKRLLGPYQQFITLKTFKTIM